MYNYLKPIKAHSFRKTETGHKYSTQDTSEDKTDGKS